MKTEKADNDRQKLIDLGAERLADALLELSIQSEAAAGYVKRMTASPEENIRLFKKKLSKLKNSRRFIPLRYSYDYAFELAGLIKDIEASVKEPLTGLQLLADFFESDGRILEQCDDSDGCVGDVFTMNASDLFAQYASACNDKGKAAEILTKLSLENNYGVRDNLIESAAEYLPLDVIRKMIREFQKKADEEKNDIHRRHYLILIESLARQIGDAKLFEQTRIASWGGLSVAAILDIARVYLKGGDAESAYQWVLKVPENEGYMSYDRNKLMTEIFRQIGDKKKLEEVLYRRFSSTPTEELLQELLDVIGNEKRGEIIEAECRKILVKPEFYDMDIRFLISTGLIDEAERYITERAGQLGRVYYGALLQLTDAMEAHSRYLAASLIYRSLLESILERAYTRAYRYGADYLKKLDKLAEKIEDWGSFPDHTKYKEALKAKHARKSSFWGNYK